MIDPRRELVRSAFSLLAVGLLAGLSLWILKPFFGAIVWATILAVATWPILTRVQRLLWGRRALAVTAMILALVTAVVGPFLAVVGAVVRNIDALTAFAAQLATYHAPPSPDWVAKLPIVGDRAAEVWDRAAEGGLSALVQDLAAYIGNAPRWLASQAGSLGRLMVQFLVTLIIVGVMYSSGEKAVSGLRAFGRRLAGPRGEAMVTLAGGAIRSIAMGVVVTALAQSLFSGLGLMITGVPFATALTIAMFVLAIAQVGPLPVLIPAVIWCYRTQGVGWGTLLLAWSLAATTLDNLVRPLLIKRGADLPLLLIFAGVLGGLVSFGLTGIFVGPVVLAIAYTLLEDWVRGESHPEGGA
jgi:predicted PurR-regulated permease PerM